MEYNAYRWHESDVPTKGLMGQYLANVQKFEEVVKPMRTTPSSPQSMENLTVSGSNAIEKILIDLNYLLIGMPRGYRHCGTTVCGMGGLIL